MTNNTTSSPYLSTKKVAIVILNWNGAKLMEEFLPSVITYSPAEEAEVQAVTETVNATKRRAATHVYKFFMLYLNQCYSINPPSPH